MIFLRTNRVEMFDTVHKALLESSMTPEKRRQLMPIQTALHCCGATLSTQNSYKSEGLCQGGLENAV